MSVLAIIFGILSLVFGLVFLIDCIRFRKQINTYVKYGIVCGLILVAIDTAVLPFIPNFFSIMPLYKLIVIDFVALVRIMVFTCMGMYCCSFLNIRAFSLVRPVQQVHDQPGLFNRAFFVSVLCTTLLAVGYSVVLFRLTSPGVSEFLKRLSDVQTARSGVGSKPSFLMAFVVLEFAFAEEIIFRLGIQNYLARQFKLQGNRYWIAVLLTTLFWSLAHANTLDPEWVKIAQVFPLGLALGFLFRKYGTETCVFVHGAFNLIMMCLAPSLMSK